MPIYFGSQKVKPNGIKEAYFGSQKVYSVSRLPSAYQEVEWIQSSGTQYFNLNRTLNQTNKIELDFQFLQEAANGSRSGAVFGDWQGTYFAANPNNKSTSYTNRLIIWRGSDSVVIDTNTYTATPFINRSTLIIDAPNNSAQWQNMSITTPSATGSTTACYLLAAKLNGNMEILNIPTKIYSLKIYTNGALSNEYIPCYRKLDSEIGIYDLVNNVFYTNQGTGSFTKGNNI